MTSTSFDSANLVALNSTYADGDVFCGGYSSSADVQLIMPSGYSQYASAFQYWDLAEAIAFAPLSGEVGTGSIDGENQLSYDCGDFLSGSFQRLFDATPALTKFKLTGLTPSGCREFTGPDHKIICDWAVTSWCTATTTPPLFDVDAITDALEPPPIGFWVGGAFCVKLFGTWHCSHGFFVQTSDGSL